MSIKTIADVMKETGLGIEDIVSKAKTRLISVAPFWGVLVANAPVFIANDPSSTHKTAWTDGFSIWFDLEFLLKLSMNEFRFVLAHEVWHISNLHIPRLGAREPQLWNVATDNFINNLLFDEIQAYKSKGTTDLFDIPDFPRIFNKKDSSIVLDRQYVDQAAEIIYADLMRKQKPEDQKKGNNGNQPQQGSGGDAMGGDLDYESNQRDERSQSDKAKDLERHWKNQLASAVQAGKKAGNLPGNVARWVDEITSAKVDYQTLLAAFLSFTPADYDFCQPDRRFTDWDFSVPDMIGEQLKCALIIDTSGSMSNEQIKQIISECYGIINSFDKVSGTLIGHDHGVHDWHEFSSDNPPPTKLKGGGGTDFHCVVNEMKERDYTPDVAIWFTDGYAHMIDKTGYPMIFVGVNTPVQFPDWATQVHIELDQ